MVAALLLAVSPFHIWYAQEARMYTLVTLLGVMSSWLLLRLCRSGIVPDVPGGGHNGRPTNRSDIVPDVPGGDHDGHTTDGSGIVPDMAAWALYALINIAAIYTHYYAFFLVAFQALYLIVWWVRTKSPRSLLVPGVAAQAATLLAYLPWAGFALTRYAVDESYWEGALSLDFVRKTLLAFSAGHTVFESQAQVIALGYVVLAALGVALLVVRLGPPAPQFWGDSSPESRAAPPPALGAGGAVLFLLLYLVVPFILLYLFSAWRPKFNPRYLMLASPPFFMLIAAAIGALWRWPDKPRWRLARRVLAAVALFYVLGTSAYALANNYTNHVYVRDDFRSVAARIAAARQPDEAVILCSGHLFPVYQYYAPQEAAYRVPDIATLSTKAVLTYDVTDRLNDIAARHGGVWLVLWQNDVVDPTGILTSLLDAQAERVPEENIYWGIELRHYRLSPGVRFVAPQMAGVPNVNFANKLSLLGMNLATPAVTSGESIALTLFWQAQQPLDDDYWVSLRLVDQFGRVVSTLNDRLAGYAYPTTRWQARTTVPGSFRLLVMPATAPGEYQLQVIVFSLARAQSLDVLDQRGAPSGVSAIVGKVSVRAPERPPAIESLGLANVLRLPMGGDMELLATSLSDRTVRQGETISFAIAWRNSARLTQDYAARLRLVADGKLLSDISAPLAGTDYPTSRWPAGSIVRTQYELTIPADAPPQVQVQVGLEGAGAPQTIARLTVSQVARTTAVPAFEYAQKAEFGAVATLLGYDISPRTVKPGQTLNLTLYWQAAGSTARPYAVFTHLLGADQHIYGQHDSQPVNDTRPTTGWLPGEIIVDRHSMVVKPETPPGDYVLEIGLYDPVNDRRLDVVTGDGNPADHVMLTTHVRVDR
jgi:hypothetical protein